MIYRKIEPTQVRRNGKLVWSVYVPQDLLTPGTLKRRYFGEDNKAADEYAKQLTESRKCVGGGSSEFMKLNGPEQAAVITGLHELGVDNLLKAIAHWRAMKPATTMSVQAAVDECVEAKRQSCCRANYLATLRCSLDNFARANRNKSLHEVTTNDVKTWLNGNGWQPKTRLGYLKDVSTLFKYAIKNGIVTRNPADGVDRPRLDQKAIQLFNVEDCQKLLTAVKHTDPALIGYIAPILFGGLRPRESGRLTAANVRAGVIDLSGPQTKGRKRRVVKIDGLLRQWLAIPFVAPRQGPAVEYGSRNLAKRLRKVAKAAGVAWSHDVLRHTFCSYAMEKLGAREAAAMAGHSEQVLFAHYRQIVQPEAATAFWNLPPDSVNGQTKTPEIKPTKNKKKCNSTSKQPAASSPATPISTSSTCELTTPPPTTPTTPSTDS
jgi:integrase